MGLSYSVNVDLATNNSLLWRFAPSSGAPKEEELKKDRKREEDNHRGAQEKRESWNTDCTSGRRREKSIIVWS